MYDRTTVQGATFNMRGQLYRGHANATALSSSPVVSALCSESEDPRRVGKKKMRAPLLGLAKSIYYYLSPTQQHSFIRNIPLLLVNN